MADDTRHGFDITFTLSAVFTPVHLPILTKTADLSQTNLFTKGVMLLE